MANRTNRRGHRPRLPAAGPFAAWLDACGISIAKVARRLRVTPAFVYNVRAGRYRPSLETAARIERLTDGAVTASSWARR